MSRETLIAYLKTRRTEIEPDQDVVVEMFKPEDALGVCLAYYEIYGESFPIEHVYDPEEVVRRNATEEQYTVVARTPRGEIVGLAGLFRPAPNRDVYEAGQLMVLKPYRGHELAKRIVSMILGDLPDRLGLPVVFAEAVCNTPVSQQLAYGMGLRPSGLAIECMPAGAYSREGEVTANVSLLLMFSVKKDRTHKVYLPAAYAQSITGMYERLALVRRVAKGSEPAGKTLFTDSVLPGIELARLTVEKAGDDFLRVIGGIEAQVGECGLIQVSVNLGDEAAPAAADQLRKKGYMFGGLLPLWFNSDGLMLQRLPREPRWAGIKLRNEESGILLDYLKEDYSILRTVLLPGL